MKSPHIITGFVNAIRGFLYVIRHERNMTVHLSIALAVIVAGFLFRITALEWIAVIICICMVLAAECFNTAIERLGDRIAPGRDSLIGLAKDAAAAGVLVISLGSVITGAIIFGPRLLAIVMPAS